MEYQIKIDGLLDETWFNWVGKVELRSEEVDGVALTVMTVNLVDQSALFGLLDHIRDLNLTLVSVNQLP